MKAPTNSPAKVSVNDSSYLLNWPDLVAPLIESINTDCFAAAFFDSINRIAPLDSALILLFRADQEPVVLYDRLHPSEESSFYDVYLGGAYLLSPLYRRFQGLPSGFYRLGALENQNFEKSDFGTAYFNQSGLCDDANFLQKLDDDTAIIASFGRQQLQLPFTDQELQHLHVASPVYLSALNRQWGAGNLPELANPSASARSHNQLKSSLNNFGNTVLTAREQMVLQLMLAGKPSKTSARELNISVDTERGHRKNIYSKLKVTSQAQLFSLIFSVLGEVANFGIGSDAEADPYASYLQTVNHES
ncbi:MAG: DNA-binding CsgD family transcriptional regulator [Arenicella sp.]|jgi:DNA-binding CsgD family transcriptional regulator